MNIEIGNQAQETLIKIGKGYTPQDDLGGVYVDEDGGYVAYTYLGGELDFAEVSSFEEGVRWCRG